MAAMNRVSTLKVLVSPTRSNSPSCRTRQELDLELGRGAVDLVQEDAAGVRGLEPAGAVLDGAGERALDVAEQLALQEALGQGPAVDADVGAGGAQAQVVDGAGDQLLAGAGLADDQDAGARGGDAAGRAVDLAHGGAGADDPRQRGLLRGEPRRGPEAAGRVLRLRFLGHDHRGHPSGGPSPVHPGGGPLGRVTESWAGGGESGRGSTGESRRETGADRGLRRHLRFGVRGGAEPVGRRQPAADERRVRGRRAPTAEARAARTAGSASRSRASRQPGSWSAASSGPNRWRLRASDSAARRRRSAGRDGSSAASASPRWASMPGTSPRAADGGDAGRRRVQGGRPGPGRHGRGRRTAGRRAARRPAPAARPPAGRRPVRSSVRERPGRPSRAIAASSCRARGSGRSRGPDRDPREPSPPVLQPLADGRGPGGRRGPAPPPPASRT